MDKSKAREDLERLYDAIPSTKPEDGMMTISWEFALDLHHNLSQIVAAAESILLPPTRDEVRLIEAVRKATSTYDYDKVTTAHRNIGRLDALARHYGHEVDLQTVDALEHTLVGFDTSARRIISALKEFDDAR